MKKIITIIGARPQFIKAAALSRQFAQIGVNEWIIHTGQHFDSNMSDVFFEEMDIPAPAYRLDIHSLPHGAMTGRMLDGIERILENEKPDGVLVYGDTNSTLAGALAAVKMHIPVIHVEAGLRSFNMNMPEEINRILTDRISSVLFCPTETAVKNLQREGFNCQNPAIVKNGDVMQDTAIFYAKKAEKKSNILQTIDLQQFALATIHRQENTDIPENLQNIISALNEINSEMSVVVPLHPRTRKIIENQGIKTYFRIIKPVSYFDMIMLLKSCKTVITDSGGVQKEAFFFGKNCVTLREQTEWTELVENGFNILAGSNPEKICQAFFTLINRKSDFSLNLYGNGKAAEIAAKIILATEKTEIHRN
ncbi:MAG: UDP-N-acetylglucosamine 2-epimerase (non-hydrolyzing) [Prevotellaceae bacterium]|jgi:UDP-GlcNAc3NAcA epimerase|nr:UDP-N-acetylglucosamine 2-epimerase (non-hydrolyzing) [Prevotellaceae bacterium]